MITTLLVANRGEIASRVFATCRRLGITTAAIHSEADAGLPFVRDADRAVALPGNTPTETYLDADAVLEAALALGADAIHPGYGFLSENAAFARRVEEAGLTWVGPAPESIEAMGSKVEAKRLMREAGVPVLDAPDEPGADDLPLLVKASAGGGGRGMRIVRALAELETEIARAGEEAASAFGDGTVFVEPYVERGRHVEVQVLGDGAGEVVVLGERDCSVQRRHQKVIEEAPAPGLSDEVRTALHEAARAAAAAIDYRGAGTVEFLYDPEREGFWFLEMNTRLQVEHPVTEAVFDVDLVEQQIAVAEGRGLDPALASLTPRGHAIELRLYAEDPGADYQPQSGRLASVGIEHDTTFTWAPGTTVRLDAGFESGSEVSTHYDAMLAKLIVRGPTREAVIRRLGPLLARARLHGLSTNRDQLGAILRTGWFDAGSMTTTSLDGPDAPHGWAILDEALVHAAAAAVIADLAARRTVQRGIPTGWRNVVSAPQTLGLEPVAPVAAAPIEVAWLGGRDGITFPEADADVLSVTPTDAGWHVRLAWEGVATSADVVIGGEVPGERAVHVDGPLGWAHLREVPRFVDPADAVASGSLVASMPGTVVRVAVAAGDEVAAGQSVVVLEAMKMQHQVVAPTAGTVTEVAVEAGAQVAAGDVLAVVEPVEPLESLAPSGAEGAPA